MLKAKVFALVLLFPATASICFGSVLTNLPASSYYSGKSTFSGGYVEFAVYDTTTYTDEFVSDYSISGSGRYIYAYQVFSDSIDISYFVIQGITAGGVTSSNVLTVQDLNGTGTDTSNEYLSVDETKAIYEFEDGYLVSAGANSWILILVSDYTPTVGSYSLTAPDDTDIPAPGDDSGDGDSGSSVPEPMTLGLLLVGMVMARRCKKA